MSNAKRTIVVVGATGQQGKGVVNALKAKTDFSVRALTRNPDSYRGQADQVVAANLNDIATLKTAFDGAYGVFLVTNFWEQGTDEITQAKNALSAAKVAGVEHLVWSTLPDAGGISGGNYDVPHFTNKAAVDELITAAGFKYHSFVVASFFYQNLLTELAPKPQPDGTTGWVLPIARDSKSIHMADINELGDAVAGAFANPDLAGQGQYLPVVGEVLSFDEIITTLEQLGKKYSYQEVPAEVFANFFPGAGELADMFGYFQKHSYLGGQFDENDMLLEQKVAGRIPTRFTDWAAGNM